MQFDRETGTITASKGDGKSLRQIATFKPQTKIPALGLWRERDDKFLWGRMVSQIFNRGGTASLVALNDTEATGRLRRERLSSEAPHVSQPTGGYLPLTSGSGWCGSPRTATGCSGTPKYR